MVFKGISQEFGERIYPMLTHLRKPRVSQGHKVHFVPYIRNEADLDPWLTKVWHTRGDNFR